MIIKINYKIKRKETSVIIIIQKIIIIDTRKLIFIELTIIIINYKTLVTLLGITEQKLIMQKKETELQQKIMVITITKNNNNINESIIITKQMTITI